MAGPRHVRPCAATFNPHRNQEAHEAQRHVPGWVLLVRGSRRGAQQLGRSGASGPQALSSEEPPPWAALTPGAASCEPP